MELLDIVNENNELTGDIVEREIVHEMGLWHREVAVIIVNKEGKMLLEKEHLLRNNHQINGPFVQVI